MNFYCRCFKYLLKFMFTSFLTDVIVDGEENIPKDGNFIVASNHQSNLDPPVLMYAFPREISFMAKMELFSVPVLAWCLKMLGAVPINRGRSLPDVFRKIIAELKKGKNMVVFPEGTRSPDGILIEAKGGVGFIAKESGARIIPVAITGTSGILPRNSFVPHAGVITVSFGKPISLEEVIAGETIKTSELNARVADRVMREIAAMLPPPYRGPYA